MTAVLAYALMYAVVNLAAFAAAVALASWGVSRVDECTGLARSHPWIGGSLAFALLCLAGLPPGIVGLIAKVAVFQRAVDGIGVDTTWLAVVMAVNVAIGLVYYLRFLVVAAATCPGRAAPRCNVGRGRRRSDDDWEGLDPDVPWSTEFVVGVTLAAALVLSVFPGLCSPPSRPDLGGRRRQR